MVELEDSVRRRECMYEKINATSAGFSAEARKERTDRTLIRYAVGRSSDSHA
jgi:hypothetical protein